MGGNITMKLGGTDCDNFNQNPFSQGCQAVINTFMNFQLCEGMQYLYQWSTHKGFCSMELAIGFGIT